MVRQACPDAHTVVVTGHPRELGGLVQLALQNGADAVYYKPFDIPELLATVGRLAGGRPAGGAAGHE